MNASLILIISAGFFLAIGVPVAFALGLATFATLVIADSFPLLVLLKETFTGIDSFPLMAVPFFILAAELMSGGSLTEVLLKFAGQFVGHKRGGLGYTNVVSLTFFSGISGSALADAAGPGSMLIRIVDEAGYDRSYAAALTAATAIVGPIISPSIIMIIYALQNDNVSVGALFIAGFIPGILIAAAMCVVNFYVSKKRNYRGDASFPPWPESGARPGKPYRRCCCQSSFLAECALDGLRRHPVLWCRRPFWRQLPSSSESAPSISQWLLFTTSRSA